jgi:hypothetical protein
LAPDLREHACDLSLLFGGEAHVAGVGQLNAG